MENKNWLTVKETLEYIKVKDYRTAKKIALKNKIGISYMNDKPYFNREHIDRAFAENEKVWEPVLK